MEVPIAFPVADDKSPELCTLEQKQEAQWVREKASTENVYTELHLMVLINQHTGNK